MFIEWKIGRISEWFSVTISLNSIDCRNQINFIQLEENWSLMFDVDVFSVGRIEVA